MTQEELQLKQREQWEAFHKDKEDAQQQYQRLYDKYYKTANEITNDQRAEVRQAFSEVEKDYGKDKLNEMIRNHVREREEYNTEAYAKWTTLEDRREELVQKYGKVDNIPKGEWDKYIEAKRHYNKEWGENGYQRSAMQADHSKELYEHEKALQAYHEKNMSPYGKMVKQQMKEREEFNGRAADHWREHERFHDSLQKEYKGWQNVPAYQKDLYKKGKEDFEKEWGDDGKQKQSMRKRHKDEIAAHMRIEASKKETKQKDRDREKE